MDVNRLKEAHQTLHERTSRNGKADAAKPADRPAAPEPNRLERAEQVRAKLKELGPDATREDLRAALPFFVSGPMYYGARKALGFAGRRGRPAKAAKGRPALPVPKPTPKPVAAPQRPAARDTDQVLEGIALLAQAADRLGGIDQCRRAIETLELLRS